MKGKAKEMKGGKEEMGKWDGGGKGRKQPEEGGEEERGQFFFSRKNGFS